MTNSINKYVFKVKNTQHDFLTINKPNLSQNFFFLSCMQKYVRINVSPSLNSFPIGIQMLILTKKLNGKLQKK